MYREVTLTENLDGIDLEARLGQDGDIILILGGTTEWYADKKGIKELVAFLNKVRLENVAES